MKKRYYPDKSGRKAPAAARTGAAGRKKRPKLRLKPGSDPKLKRIFSIIGIPEQAEWVPDPFQLKAIAAVKKTDCIVTAPTGAGKTWIAEQVILRMLETGQKTWYASPLKALSNAIFESFSRLFGPENTGILTGDRKENPDAAIIIGTTEILRNQLYDSMHSGEDLDTDLVILDEAHFLGDTERGVVWEETMIYLPRRIPLLLLSATIGNPDEIAGWLSAIRDKPCQVIKETNRPVRLYPLFLHPSGTLFPLMTEGGESGKRELYKKTLRALQSDSPRISPFHGLPPMNEILHVLRRYNLLPAIFFMKSRADCDRALEFCDSEGLDKTPDRREILDQTISDIISRNPYLAGHKQLHFIKEKAVAAHHSGHLPVWKKTVEQFMNSGLLDAVFATSTVAAGVNFPARSVVIFNSDRFNGKEFMPLTSIEFHQMTGRAGRRGKDNIGFAVMVPGKFMDIRHVAKLINSSPSSINSQIRINFSMALNLLLALSLDQIRNLLQYSFARYQREHSRHTDEAPETDLWQDLLDHVAFLQETGYAEESGRLTEDGRWASQLRVDHPLMIAEGFRLGLFPKSDPALIAAIIASFVNERQTDDPARKPEGVPKKLRSAFSRVRNKLTPFLKHMFRRGFVPTELHLAPAITMYRWSTGVAWDRVVREASIEEGDLANLVFRTADNLRHIATLKDVFPEEAAAASQAVGLIMKEPLV